MVTDASGQPVGGNRAAARCADEISSMADAHPSLVAEELRLGASEIATVHRHCAVFTRPEVAEGILDFVGWDEKRDLVGQRLLEPACGDGAFLRPAVERLLASAERSGRLKEVMLKDAVVAFEFDPTTAELARIAVARSLGNAGFDAEAASRLAGSWVRCEDFLLADKLGTFTHVVGNPPYMRWSKLPSSLRRSYEAALPAHAARGDLCLSFVWRAAELTEPTIGRVAFLCADRWLRCAYGESARAALMKTVRLAMHLEVHSVPVFLGQRKVGAYAAITVLDRNLEGGSVVEEVATLQDLQDRLGGRTATACTTKLGRALGAEGGAVLAGAALADVFRRMYAAGVRLGDAGVVVRCGMALGCAPVFIIEDERPVDIEADRLLPFIRTVDLAENGRAEPTASVLNVWSDDETLVRLTDYPKLEAYLQQHKIELQSRACVGRDEQWYRTIDRIDRRRVGAPKILVAGMAKASRVAMSQGGCQHSNALYGVTSLNWPLEALFALFRRGVLDVFAAVLAPRFSGGSKRFDGNVLGQVRIPLWSSLDNRLKKGLLDLDASIATPDPELIARIYGLRGSGDVAVVSAATVRPKILKAAD